MGNSHFQQSFLEKSSIEHIGQFHSGGLLEQTRRHKIPRPVSTSLGFPMVQGAQRVVEVRSYCRKEKYCNSRQIVQGKDNQSNRVGVTSDSCGSHLSSMVPPSHSSIYHKGEQEAPNVLFSSSQIQLWKEWILHLLGGDDCIRVPPPNWSHRMLKKLLVAH